MSDGILVEVVLGSHDPILKFLLGGDTDLSDDSSIRQNDRLIVYREALGFDPVGKAPRVDRL